MAGFSPINMVNCLFCGREGKHCSHWLRKHSAMFKDLRPKRQILNYFDKECLESCRRRKNEASLINSSLTEL